MTIWWQGTDVTRLASILAIALLTAVSGFAQEGGLAAFEDQFVRVVEQARPSVVAVTSRFRVEIEEDTDLEEEGKSATSEVDEWQTTYSGVILDGTGRIVTVASAVAGAHEIEVRLHDDRVLPARVLGTDAKSNLAVIQVDAAGLTPSRFAAELPRVGSWVVAIGNPFGLSGSVAYGIVSGIHRTIGAGERVYSDMIQTTAPVNPGDAGGLVVNLRGEMVGLTCSTFQRATSIANLQETMKRWSREFDFKAMFEDLMQGRAAKEGEPKEGEESRTDGMDRFWRRLFSRDRMPRPEGGTMSWSQGNDAPLGAEGINFLVPVARVKEISDTLVAKGSVPRAFLGLRVSPIDPALRAHLGIVEGDGVLVVGVAPESPAGHAGLQIHDVLLALGAQAVQGLADLESAMIRNVPGSSVEVKIVRHGKPATISVVLGKRD